MNALADEGFVLFAGPLAGTEHGRLRALLIVNADSEAEIHRRLADDPWDARRPTPDIEHRAVEHPRRRRTTLRARHRRGHMTTPAPAPQRATLLSAAERSTGIAHS